MKVKLITFDSGDEYEVVGIFHRDSSEGRLIRHMLDYAEGFGLNKSVSLQKLPSNSPNCNYYELHLNDEGTDELFIVKNMEVM